MSENKVQRVAPTLIKLDNSGNIDLSVYDANQLTSYKTLSTVINPQDSTSLMNFGSDTRNKMSGFADTMLANVRTTDVEEFGGYINDLLGQLNMINIDDLEQSAFTKMLLHIPILKNLVLKSKEFFQKYDTVANNVNKIANNIQKGKINSIKDNVVLEAQFNNNVKLIDEVCGLIIAGSIKKNELNATLAEMETNATNYQDYEISDLREFINRLDRRVADLQTTRLTLIQSLAQIRLVQNNNNMIAEKADSIIANTIPLWKNQLVVAVAISRQKNAIAGQKLLTDTTNAMMVKMSEQLKMNSIEVAKESEKTVIALETMKKVHNDLIETVMAVRQIHIEGAESRKQLGVELETLETELKSKLIS